MKTKLLRGTSDQLNGLNLPSGFLAQDIEKRALRVYDGVTPGGFEMLGIQAHTPPLGPGPTILSGGDLTAGFYGEVTGAELITYDGLSSLVGISAGDSTHNAESLWLKFSLDNRVLFVAKKPARKDFSWNTLLNANLIYGRAGVDPTFTIGDVTYAVRLLRGANQDPTPPDVGNDTSITHNSEWNRLIYSIHVGTGLAEPSVPFAQWASYTDSDLFIAQDYEMGMETWDYEENHLYATRGNNNLTSIATRGKGAGIAEQWRPVLEIVS